MNELQFSFEQTPWEKALAALNPGDSLSAAAFLALLEGEDESETESALKALEDKRITLVVGDLPKNPGTGSTALRLRQEQQLAEKGQLMEGLEENDTLRLYLEEVAGTPVAGDPALLAQKLLEGDEPAAARLAELMLSRVVAVATENTGRGVLLLDLIQEGSLGLWQGIMEYAGGDFEAHIDWWIRQYVANAVTMQARSTGVGQKLRQAAEDYRTVDERLLTELGRNPTMEEIAEMLHMSLQETAVVAQMLESARMLQRTGKPETEELPQEEEQAVEDTAYFQMRQRISELLSSLSEQDAKLLTLRYGLEGGLPMNPQQVGEKLGLTAEEVVAREATALTKLRQSQ